MIISYLVAASAFAKGALLGIAAMAAATSCRKRRKGGQK